MEHHSYFEQMTGGAFGDMARAKREKAQLKSVEELVVRQDQIAKGHTGLMQDHLQKLSEVKNEIHENRLAITSLAAAQEEERERSRKRNRNALIVAMAILAVGLINLFA